MNIWRRTKRLARAIASRWDGYWLVLASRNRWCAKLYYGLFHGAFSREFTSFAAGRLAYKRNLSAPSGSMTVLRRNVHRIEKGLLMRPRRVPFATGYIGETVEAFQKAADGCIDPEEWRWARDVLEAYFEAHREVAEVESQRRRFECCRGIAAEESRIPYQRDLSQGPPVTVEQMKALALRRRSVRWFLPKPVPRAAIDLAIEIGTQAPSACNRQPFVFRIFDDRELAGKIIDLPMGLAGYGHQVPVVIVVVGQQRNFFSERDRHLIYIDSSLAVMGVLFALESQGLSACCVNWPDIESREQKMAEALQLSADERPIMLIAVGYPDPEGLVANSTKKSLSLIRRYNFE